MYCVCKFSGTWSVYDGTTKKSKLLEETEVGIIRGLFAAALREDAILDSIMVTPVSAGKLQPLSKPALPGGPVTFYVCKFSSTWTLYDTATKNDRPLTAKEISMLLSAFAGAIDQNAILLALLITPISPNKLQQLTTRQSSVSAKKMNHLPGKVANAA